MASKSKQIPSDGIRLSELQASSISWELVNGWNEGKDTWALRYGPGVLGGICSAGGVLINSHFRTRVKLGKIGIMSSLLPTVLLPGLFTVLFHRTKVATDILLDKKKSCFLCYEIQSAGYQLLFGVVYPMVMAPLTCFMVANRYNTIRIPSIVEQPKELFKFLLKISKSQTGLLSTLAMVHVAASSLITYYEIKNHLTIQSKLKAIEQKLDLEINAA